MSIDGYSKTVLNQQVRQTTPTNSSNQLTINELEETQGEFFSNSFRAIVLYIFCFYVALVI